MLQQHIFGIDKFGPDHTKLVNLDHAAPIDSFFPTAEDFYVKGIDTGY